MSDQLLQQFKEFVRSSNLQYSYKLVLLSVMLPLVDANGLANIDAVVQSFRDYYLARQKSGLAIDRPGAAINKVASMTVATIKALLLDNPFAAYSRAGWMHRVGERIGLAPGIWAQMTLAEREELWQLADQRLSEYYENRVGSDSLQALLNEVLSTYGDARNQRFSSAVPIVRTITQDIPSAIKASGLVPSETYKLVGSTGMGNWASVPWVAMLDRKVTESIQSGVYVVYLFSSDMQSIYLSLMLGVTEFLRTHTGRAGLEELRAKAAGVRAGLNMDGFQWKGAAFGEERLAKQYEAGLIAYIRYDRGAVPEDDKLLVDLKGMLALYQQLASGIAQPPPLTVKAAVAHAHQFITASGFQYSYTDLANFYLSLRTKPFVILAGISGTGKSLLPKLFANAISGERRIIPVRPDWNDGSDLLGYLDLEGRFRSGELTSIVEECRANPDVPYFVVLDEMNLARVEHYMSDLLSIMETRHLDDVSIVTEPLFKESHFKVAEDRERYAGTTLPENLYLVGTVNMDETTHPFSKKVLDRANTIEFSQVNLKGYTASGGELPEQIVLRNDQLRGKLVHLADALAQDPTFVDSVVDKLEETNRILSQANLQVGYRVRDEIVIYMLHNRQLELLEEAEAFDYQLLQKILPRIQGSSQPVRKVLVELLSYCGRANLGAANDDILARLQEYESGDAKGPYPRSAAKLAIMLRRYEEDGFTSYWI